MSRFPLRALLMLAGFALFGAGASMTALWYLQPAPTGPQVLPTPRRLTLQSLAPDFVLESADGRGPIPLHNFAGKRLLINFWASWCGPCQHETPDLVQAYKNMKEAGNDDVEFIGIASRDEEAKVREFVAKFGVPYPIVLDGTGIVGDAYSLYGMPSTYYIGSDGKIVKQVIGVVNTEAIITQFKTMEPSKK